MKKQTPIFVLSALILAGCGCSQEPPKGSSYALSSEQASSSIKESSIQPSSSGEESIASSIESSEESSSAPKKTVSGLNEEEYPLLPQYYLEHLASFSTYKAVTSGKTTATLWLIKTDQSIDVTFIKNEYSYLKNESHSTLVNTVHEAYFKGEGTLVRDKDHGDFEKKTLEAYKNTYGVYPLDDLIEGYLINEDTLTKIEKVEAEEDYAFRLTLNPEAATTYVAVQMQKFGGLDEKPTFSKIEITLTLKDDFTPVKIDLNSEYKAKKFIGTDCVQSYTVTFSCFDEEIEVPNLTEIKEKYEF